MHVKHLTVDLVIVADDTDAECDIAPRWASPVATLWSTAAGVRLSAGSLPSVRAVESLWRAVEFALRLRYSAELFATRARLSAAKLDPRYESTGMEY